MGEYAGIWLFARANILESGYSPGRKYWNMVIRPGYKKLCFPLKMSIWRLGNVIRSRIIVELLSPGEYCFDLNVTSLILKSQLDTSLISFNVHKTMAPSRG